jgi:hypothetical protein
MFEHKIEEINSYLKKEMWYDFEILEYKENCLIIIGSTDFTYSHSIEIKFEDVFLSHFNTEWKSDTTKNVIEVVSGDEARIINVKNRVEQGYILFKFIPEDMEENCFFYIAAKNITYNIDTVLYSYKESLNENERIADWVK